MLQPAIPAGELLTDPPLLTVVDSVYCGVGEKVAVTACADVPTFTVHVVAVPVHPPPLHPAKVEAEDAGVSVKTTDVLALKFPEQVPVVQLLIPPGKLLTDPEPVPDMVTETGKVAATNVALTDCTAFIVTVQVVAVPEQPPPLQPANAKAEEAGVSVSVTDVPLW